MLSFLREQFPPEAEVRGSNPLGRAMYIWVRTKSTDNMLNKAPLTVEAPH